MKCTRAEYLIKVRKCLDLREAGLSYEQIASEVGYKHAMAAWKAVMYGLKATITEPSAAVRQLELRRLDKLYREVQAGKDPGLIAVQIKIQERRARLLGLDAPQKQEVTGKDGGPIQVERSPKDVTEGIQAFREAILRAQQPAGGNGASGGNGTSHA